MSRFVKGKTAVLTLANGDTLVVKHRLNRGESAEMFARMRPVGDAGARLDRLRVGLAKVSAYLLDWQLKDDNEPIAGLSIDDKDAVLNNLDPDDFNEMRAAIEAHEEKVQAERDAEKNGKGGAKESSAISPSLDSTAGATNGSTNSTPTSTTSS